MLISWLMGFGIFGFLVTVSRNGLWDSSEPLLFFGGTVSKNMLIQRCMGLDFFDFQCLGLSRELCSFPISESWATKGKSLQTLDKPCRLVDARFVHSPAALLRGSKCGNIVFRYQSIPSGVRGTSDYSIKAFRVAKQM